MRSTTARPGSDTAIGVYGLTKRFGAVAALQGLDLEVPAGAVFGFLGPNGAGKTTALSILAGLAHATSGEARICGLDVASGGTAVRSRIGFLRQDPRYYGWMTGRETLQFTGRFFDLTPDEIDTQANELLDLVDLSGAAHRKMSGYSGGMRQRLGIAQALMGRPEVLLLDEPCSSLDPAGRLEVMQIMERLRGSITVFYSTHILQDVERVADQVAIIADGRRVMQGPIHELLAGGASTLTLEIEGDCARLRADLRRQRYVREVECSHDANSPLHRLRIEVADVEAARRAVPKLVVEHNVLFVGCRPEQRSLEEVFLDVTKGQSGDIQR